MPAARRDHPLICSRRFTNLRIDRNSAQRRTRRWIDTSYVVDSELACVGSRGGGVVHKFVEKRDHTVISARRSPGGGARKEPRIDRMIAWKGIRRWALEKLFMSKRRGQFIPALKLILIVLPEYRDNNAGATPLTREKGAAKNINKEGTSWTGVLSIRNCKWDIGHKRHVDTCAEYEKIGGKVQGPHSIVQSYQRRSPQIERWNVPAGQMGGGPARPDQLIWRERRVGLIHTWNAARATHIKIVKVNKVITKGKSFKFFKPQLIVVNDYCTRRHNMDILYLGRYVVKLRILRKKYN